MSLIRTTVITPLDPDSEKGREVAATLTRILDDLAIEIAAERAASAAVDTAEPIEAAA